MIDVSVLGYCWGEELMGGYFTFHRNFLKFIGHDLSVTHLCLKFNDWVVHPFSHGVNKKEIKWIKEKVATRCFGNPCQEIYLGQTNYLLSDIISYANEREINTWSTYAYLYTMGYYKNKKDCVSFTKEMLDFCLGLGPFKEQFPSYLLKEISNHGY